MQTAMRGKMASSCFTRTPVKHRGRASATDELRSRCLARVREGREQLLNRLRESSDESGACNTSSLRKFTRDIIAQECLRELERKVCEDEGEDPFQWEALLAMEQRLDLEEAMLAELQLEAVESATKEAEDLEADQNAADRALFEQHELQGLPCPLCSTGRLALACGMLQCAGCGGLEIPLMGEEMALEDVAELLADAEWRHVGAGCGTRPTFEVRQDFGSRALHLRCAGCGWSELVL